MDIPVILVPVRILLTYFVPSQKFSRCQFLKRNIYTHTYIHAHTWGFSGSSGGMNKKPQDEYKPNNLICGNIKDTFKEQLWESNIFSRR